GGLYSIKPRWRLRGMGPLRRPTRETPKVYPRGDPTEREATLAGGQRREGPNVLPTWGPSSVQPRQRQTREGPIALPSPRPAGAPSSAAGAVQRARRRGASETSGAAPGGGNQRGNPRLRPPRERRDAA